MSGAPGLSSLDPEQRIKIVDQAITLFEFLYVHLPLKEAMHAVRPVQRLRLLRESAADLTIRQFHTELIETFNSVRDLHTNYVLPNPFAKLIRYLPFQVEAYIENGVRKYAVSHVIAGFTHDHLVPGVEVLHWSGVPIERAVEISGDQHAGSNSAARHVRGVEGLTIRPLAQALPPDSEWVDVRYRTQDGDIREDRFAWETFKLPSNDEGFVAKGTALAGLASVGVDHERDMIRRANKKLYVPDVLDRQRQRRETEFPYPSFATIPSPGGRPAGGARGTARRRRRLAETPVRPHGLPSGAFSARDFPSRDFADREEADRDEPNRDFRERDFPSRDFADREDVNRDEPNRDFPERDFASTGIRALETPDHLFTTRGFPKRGFPVRGWPNRGDVPLVDGGARRREAPPNVRGQSFESFLPQVFNANTVPVADTSYGHIRIRTFSVNDEWLFLNEFIRLLALMPRNGLILDVRGNSGGLILAGEMLLQTLTPAWIEPERVQFVTNAVTRALIDRHSGANRPYGDFSLEPWKESADQAVRTGAAYTQAFPITDPAAANQVGQQYHGPVVLITDALCYSTTDIFAAGFQDHGIGKIIGVDANTGAGGANVWTHDLLRTFFDGVPGNPIKALPKGVGMRVAIRRTLRTGAAAGTPVEDLGVVPDVAYGMTRRDLFQQDVDLLSFAGNMLSGRPVYRLDVAPAGAASGTSRRFYIHTQGLQRLDLYLDGRPLKSRDIKDGRNLVTVSGEPAESSLELHGFDGGRLAAVII